LGLRISCYCCLHVNLRNGLLYNMVDSLARRPSCAISVERRVNMKSVSGVDTACFPRKMMVFIFWRRKLIIDAEEGLLRSASATDSIHGSSSPTKEQHTKLTIWQFLRSPVYKPMIRAILIVMLAQQLSGINAVIFYSTSILSSILPSSSALISLIISLINLGTTLPSTTLIERSGRKPLLLWSISSMGVASLFLGLGIVYSWRLICVISSFAFVAAFSIGLGPIPFLIISEFVDAEGVSAGQSFGLVTNWIATFCVVCPLPDLFNGRATFS
jgi:Sugar (and other) transporter